MRVRSLDFILDASGAERPVGPDFAVPGEAPGRPGSAPLESLLAFGLPASDSGHLSYNADGTLVHHLVERRLRDLVRGLLGADEIRTPILYRTDGRGIAEEASAFLDQMYHCGARGEQGFVLRPGGDYGAFTLARERPGPGAMPIRIFECGPAFRRIQRSNIDGLFSARGFTILDYHALCGREDQLWEEWAALLAAQKQAIASLGAATALTLEVVADYYHSSKGRICGALAAAGLEASVKLLDRPRNYWMLQHRFCLSGGIGVMDGQLDHVNGPRYGIPAPDGSEAVLICHGCWGTVERWVWHLLTSQGGLPYWLCPTQLALIPCSAEGERLALSLRERHRRAHRIKVDARPRSVGSRLKRALDGTCFAAAVLGDREAASAETEIEFRRPGGPGVRASASAWIRQADCWMEDYPFEPLPVRGIGETSAGN